MSKYSNEEILSEVSLFKEERKTLQLSTKDKNNNVNVSYAPFAIVENNFYILISTAAKHCNNLMSRPDLSLMLIEDESQSKNIFARRRVTYAAQAKLILRNEAQWNIGLDALEGRFGKVVRTLESFSDFNLFCLEVESGLFVKDFGQSFRLSGSDLTDVDRILGGHQHVQAKKTA